MKTSGGHPLLHHSHGLGLLHKLLMSPWKGGLSRLRCTRLHCCFELTSPEFSEEDAYKILEATCGSMQELRPRRPLDFAACRSRRSSKAFALCLARCQSTSTGRPNEDEAPRWCTARGWRWPPKQPACPCFSSRELGMTGRVHHGDAT